MSLHHHSLEAKHQVAEELGERAIEVLRAIEYLGIGTDREVLEFIIRQDKREGRQPPQAGDMNHVRPRISDLVNGTKERPDTKLLEECGSCRDHVTGQLVRKIRIIPGRWSSEGLAPRAAPQPIERATLTHPKLRRRDDPDQLSLL